MKIAEEELEYLLDNVGVEDEDRIRPAYGARGMWGGTCLGLVFDDPGKWEEFIVELTVHVLSEGGKPEDVSRVVQTARKDSMGRTGIIVYWPNGGLEMGD